MDGARLTLARMVWTEVLAEMDRQLEKWGEQNHDPFVYGAILTEETGEALQAALKWRFEGGDPEALREELVQVAAVAQAFIACLDREDWEWGAHSLSPPEALPPLSGL